MRWRIKQVLDIHCYVSYYSLSSLQHCCPSSSPPQGARPKLNFVTGKLLKDFYICNWEAITRFNVTIYSSLLCDQLALNNLEIRLFAFMNLIFPSITRFYIILTLSCPKFNIGETWDLFCVCNIAYLNSSTVWHICFIVLYVVLHKCWDIYIYRTTCQLLNWLGYWWCI